MVCAPGSTAVAAQASSTVAAVRLCAASSDAFIYAAAVAFLKRFQRAGFDARVVNIRARRDKGPRHVLFIGDALA